MKEYSEYMANNETVKTLAVDGTVAAFLPLLDLHRNLMINYRTLGLLCERQQNMRFHNLIQNVEDYIANT